MDIAALGASTCIGCKGFGGFDSPAGYIRAVTCRPAPAGLDSPGPPHRLPLRPPLRDRRPGTSATRPLFQDQCSEPAALLTMGNETSIGPVGKPYNLPGYLAPRRLPVYGWRAPNCSFRGCLPGTLSSPNVPRGYEDCLKGPQQIPCFCYTTCKKKQGEPCGGHQNVYGHCGDGNEFFQLYCKRNEDQPTGIAPPDEQGTCTFY